LATPSLLLYAWRKLNADILLPLCADAEMAMIIEIDAKSSFFMLFLYVFEWF
jgi:hypothetical protein